MRKKKKEVDALDPEAVGLDEMTRKRRRILAELKAMSADELFELMVLAGIYTKKGRLRKPYRDGEPSKMRPTD